MYILDCLKRGKTRVTQSSLVLFCIWLVEKVVQISKAITACSSSRLMQQNGPFTNMAFLRNFSCALPPPPLPTTLCLFFLITSAHYFLFVSLLALCRCWQATSHESVPWDIFTATGKTQNLGTAQWLLFAPQHNMGLESVQEQKKVIELKAYSDFLIKSR